MTRLSHVKSAEKKSQCQIWPRGVTSLHVPAIWITGPVSECPTLRKLRKNSSPSSRPRGLKWTCLTLGNKDSIKKYKEWENDGNACKRLNYLRFRSCFQRILGCPANNGHAQHWRLVSRHHSKCWSCGNLIEASEGWQELLISGGQILQKLGAINDFLANHTYFNIFEDNHFFSASRDMYNTSHLSLSLQHVVFARKEYTVYKCKLCIYIMVTFSCFLSLELALLLLLSNIPFLNPDCAMSGIVDIEVRKTSQNHLCFIVFSMFFCMWSALLPIILLMTCCLMLLYAFVMCWHNDTSCAMPFQIYQTFDLQDLHNTEGYGHGKADGFQRQDQTSIGSLRLIMLVPTFFSKP